MAMKHGGGRANEEGATVEFAIRELAAIAHGMMAISLKFAAGMPRQECAPNPTFLTDEAATAFGEARPSPLTRSH
jgi:hypothetical protein